ncbi:mRNA-decapping enzyme-like protein [Arachis duranensis]|uniref:mRNA-decapping enzyme-like protein n=1 Tax=Arachis duranensis TaxID=130453 RepID=A0A9C6WCM9_ARADU|nr:mRNA-decapping enzyme-like protein [Arachis duranensis]
MSQNGKLIPNLDQHSTKLLNITVLQCIDSFVEEILITTAHITFYEFNIDLYQWSRKDVEGSLFVVKSSILHGVSASQSIGIVGSGKNIGIEEDFLKLTPRCTVKSLDDNNRVEPV